MKFLLDTSTLLWMLFGDEKKISRKALTTIEKADDLLVSSVCLWEIAIKYSLGKLTLRDNPQNWLPEMILKMGFTHLPITHDHALGVVDLPWHHRDPFDRLLASQSRCEKMPLITPDKAFKKYEVEVVW